MPRNKEIASQSESPFNALPDEVLLNIFSNITQLEDFAVLSGVNSRLQSLTKDNNAFPHFVFFKKNFEYHPPLKQILRAVEQLTLANIYIGSRQASAGINDLLNNCENKGLSLLLSAAYFHGSAYAMTVLNMLNSLPGKIRFPIFEDSLISQYKKKLISIIEDAYQQHFPKEKWELCAKANNAFISTNDLYSLGSSLNKPLKTEEEHQEFLQNQSGKISQFRFKG